MFSSISLLFFFFFFRKPTFSYVAPCGGRTHEEGCPFSSTESQKELSEGQRVGATYLRLHSREVVSDTRYPDPDLSLFPRIPCLRQSQGAEQHHSMPLT